VLEAIYGDDLQHDEGESTNATELAAHLAALEVNATEAATIPVRAIGLHASAHYGARPLFPQLNATEAATTSGAARTTAVRVAFSVKLDGGGGSGGGSGGGGDDVSLPPEEVRLHVSLPTGNRPACKCSLRRPPPLPTGTLARLAPNGLSASKGDAALHAVASHAARSGELSDCMLIAF
jgi:hypothetical protein